MTLEQFLDDYRKIKKFLKFGVAAVFLYYFYQFSFQRGRVAALDELLQQMQAAESTPAKPDGEPGNLQHPLPQPGI